MTDTDTPDTPRTRQAVEAVNRSAPNKVTGRLRGALLDMVWKGSRRDDAALANKMSVHGLREALKRPHVKRFYLDQLGVLKESERSRTFHRLCELRDQNTNMNAAVSAAKVITELNDEQTNKPNVASPGIMLRIVNINATPAQHDEQTTIDVRPCEPELEPEPAVPFNPIFRVP